jgi:phenylacetate-CoA ligase
MASRSHRPYWSELEAAPPAEIRTLENEKLVRQLAHVADASPFYRRKFREAGVGFDDIRTTHDLQRVPFTEKDELRKSQEAHPPLGEHAAVAMERVIRVHSSSGTTGRPSYVGLSRSDRDGWTEMVARCLYASGVRPESRIVYAFSIGFFVGGLPNKDAIEEIGATLVPIGTGASERLVSAVQHLGVDQITCTPSYVQYLAEFIRSNHGLDPTSLGIRTIIVGGEPGGGVPAVRQQIESEWGAKCFDAMGNADLAPVFLGECPAQAGMHFCGQGYLFPELIDPESGERVPIEEGAGGELVVTHIDRECVPLIRFRTRDRVVVWTDPCECGRTGLRLRCVGRTDDMLIVRGGNVFPSAIKDVIVAHRPETTGELVIELDHPGPKVEPPVRILVEHGPGVVGHALQELADTLEEELRRKLIFRADVQLVAPGTLPRYEMKAKLVRLREGA